MYLNKVLIIGNLTRDPETRSLPSGIAVTTFSVATNRVWKDSSGARQESTDYHNMVVFGKQADTVAQYLKKGSMAFVEGRLQTRSWEKDGVKQYRTEIVADRVQFGPRGSEQSNMRDNSSQSSPEDSGSQTIDYPENEISPDDIPF